jgi:hypothetical protein
LTGGTSTALTELAQDYAAPLFNHASHVNITVTYDDANNKILLTGVAAQVQSNWTASSGLGVILNKPTLFSGSYTDLTSKPTLFSGSYTDLTSKPTIPTSFSSLVNGANTVSLDSNSNLTFTNGEQIKTNFLGGGIELYQSSDNTIGIYPGGAEIKTFVTGGPKYKWLFGITGKLTLSTAGIVRSGTDTAQVGYRAVFTQDIYGDTTTGAVSGMTLVDVGSNAQLLALIDVNSPLSGSRYNLLSPLTITYSDATTQTFTTIRSTNIVTGSVAGFGQDVTTAGHNFPITVTSANYAAATTAPEWTFGANGRTTFPTGLVLGAPRGSGTVNFTSAIDKEFQIETQTSSTGKLWRFETSGSTTFPSGLTIHKLGSSWVNITSDIDKVLQIATQTSGGRKEWSLGTDGNLTLPNSAVIGQASDIEITTAETNYTNGLATWEGVRASYQAQATSLGITSTGWPFIAWNATGTNVAGFISQLTTAWLIQQGAPTSPPTTLIFQPPISVAMYQEIRTALVIVRDSYAIWQALLTSVKITSGSESVTLMSNGKLIVPNIIQTDPEEDLVIRTRYAVVTSPPGIGTYSNKDFTFGTNGSLTFPDTTVQSTAYVNRITNTSTTNTTMLAVNTNVVNRDRLSIRAVSPTAGSINVEFRYIGINGANVTISANNGTNIFGYSTTGAAIGWQQFNPVVFEHVGDKAEMVISDHTYHKVYRVTAMMRDTPTQYQLGSVYCIIEELM